MTMENPPSEIPGGGIAIPLINHEFLLHQRFDFRRFPVPRKSRYVMTLVGSSRYPWHHANVTRQLSLMHFIVIGMGLFGHAEGDDMGGEWKRLADLMHLDKIDLSDGIFVVDPGGYIGESSSKEIAYALAHDKEVYYLEPVQGGA